MKADTDPRCCCRTHGQRLCPLHQPLGLDLSSLLGCLVSLLLGLWLSAILFGCGGDAASAAPAPFGWCCEDFCGLSGSESEYFEQCSCDGIVTGANGVGRGECVEPLTK